MHRAPPRFAGACFHRRRGPESPIMSQGAAAARSSSPRLESVDFLRGVAALSVVCHHAINFGWGRNMPMGVPWFRALHAVVDRGDLGVPLFFVISGFCIHLRWARARAAGGSSPLELGSFWRRRLHRLYPPYFVALCASMALVVIAYLLGHETPLISRYPEPRPRWMAL